MIKNQGGCKSFKNQLKIFRKAIAQLDLIATNEVLENTKTAMPLKHLCNFWRSMEMLLIKLKVE